MILNFVLSLYLAVFGQCKICQTWPVRIANPLYYQQYPTRGNLFYRNCGRQLQFKLYDGEPMHR